MTGRKIIDVVAIIAAVVMMGFISGCGKEETSTVQKKAPVQKTSESQSEGEWKLLSGDPDLGDWIMKESGAWKLTDGIMAKSEGGGYIWTKELYGDFILDCEFRISEGGNSGIFFRTDDIEDAVQTGLEMQVYNIARKPSPVKNDCGAVYDLLEPAQYADKPAGEWNHVVLTCNDNIITVVMNDIQIIDMDLDKWDTPGKNPDGTKNKFKRALKDFRRDGHIGFQEHGDPVWYRNVKIKRL